MLIRVRLIILSFVILFTLAGSACRNSPPIPPQENIRGGHTGEPGSLILSEEAVRTGGISATRAQVREMQRSIRASGELEFNRRRLVHLTARASGRIESIAAYRGERVAEGQILAEIYSQDYLALQSEIIQAAERAVRLRETPDALGARAFLDAACSKVVPLGITETEIESLISTKSIRPFLSVRAPFGGRIVEQAAVVGDAVESGSSLFRLADPSTLWASLRIYEKDLTSIRPGFEFVFRTQAFPGEEFRGRLVLIGAEMDGRTRTVEGRAEVPNPGEKLKSGMYIEASISAGEKRQVLAIHESSLQDFQSRPVVFVQTKPGAYELRLVETGERSGGWVEILRGLAEGEDVVVAGSFLLKSEMLKMTMGDEHEHD